MIALDAICDDYLTQIHHRRLNHIHALVSLREDVNRHREELINATERLARLEGSQDYKNGIQTFENYLAPDMFRAIQSARPARVDGSGFHGLTHYLVAISDAIEALGQSPQPLEMRPLRVTHRWSLGSIKDPGGTPQSVWASEVDWGRGQDGKARIERIRPVL
jgi:hypothetical protein